MSTRARTHARTHAHTHTHTHTTHWYNEKQMTDQSAEDKRWVFSFDLKEESEDECLTERAREFKITGPMYWKEWRWGRERKRVHYFAGPMYWNALSPRVLLLILGIWKFWVSEAEQSEQEGEYIRSNSERHGGAVPDTIWSRGDPVCTESGCWLV